MARVSFVMAGLVPAIHVSPAAKTWIPATSAGMTVERSALADISSIFPIIPL
jgi:hypothetical protein